MFYVFFFLSVLFYFLLFFFFFFNDTATTEIYTLSLHDALPICGFCVGLAVGFARVGMLENVQALGVSRHQANAGDRKSTRLNSSHLVISYAVFCLKKKKNIYYSNEHNKYSISRSHVMHHTSSNT